jgi:hypothetical protein
MIAKGEEGLQDILPKGVSETIVQNILFGYSSARKRR